MLAEVALTTAMLKGLATVPVHPAGIGAVGEILAVTPWAETVAARAEATRTIWVSILILCGLSSGKVEM